MFGWTSRSQVNDPSFLYPQCLKFFQTLSGRDQYLDTSFVKTGNGLPQTTQVGWELCLLLMLLSYVFAVLARLMELPYWENPSYRLTGEFLLATHDAYHWIAGAEGFEFGAGHPMSELVRIVARFFNASIANTGFWMPPFFGGLIAVAVYLWTAGLGFPFAGFCAGILASLSPSFFARTLLGFYDTDLVVLLFSVLIGLIPALWLHPWLCSFTDLYRNTIKSKADVPVWLVILVTVVVIASTGVYLFFNDPIYFGTKTISVVIPLFGFVSVWIIYSVHKKAFDVNTQEATGGMASAMPCSLETIDRGGMQATMVSPFWLTTLLLAGVFGYWTQSWHSFFPYYVRYSALLILVLSLVLGPVGGRKNLIKGGVCYALPLLTGLPGLLAGALYALCLWYEANRAEASTLAPSSHEEDGILGQSTKGSLSSQALRLIGSTPVVIVLWCLILFLCCDTTVYSLMKNSFSSYVHRGGDIAANAVKELVFPSVNQSIIEVQTVPLDELLTYFYPDKLIPLLCVFAVFFSILTKPVILWFVPLLALSFMGVVMGGRMVMFGGPVLMMCFCIEGGNVFRWLWRSLPFLLPRTEYWGFCFYFLRTSVPLRLFICLGITGLLVWPLVVLIPAYTQGPIISRDQAAGLSFIKNNSPEDSIVWNWWDWGYATHHFSQRITIADGARHGGPSLYLPAVVYTTADPRFARQVIKYTALKENIPGNVFKDLSGEEAQNLMVDLGDKSKPLLVAPGKQYLVVSFELLRLGAWVTRYGSWNFVRKSGQGALMNNIFEPLRYDPETGRVATESNQVIDASSIDVFASTGVTHYSYPGRQRNHFIFNMQSHADAVTVSRKSHSPLVQFWEWQQGSFQFTATTSDIIVVDPIFYNTVMVQLLLGKTDDPSFAPYFKCVFDNVYCRIFEVQ